jgi:redox-sensing transcriptional repressor
MENSSPSVGRENNPQSASPISRATAVRLSLYLRELRRLQREAVAGISSQDLGNSLGVSDAVVRRDLACLGQLGRRGVGYSVQELICNICEIMGMARDWHVLLVGAGNLGTALLRYRGFGEQGFRVVAAIDNDPRRVGGKIGDVEIFHLDQLEETVETRQVSLGILAIPAEDAPAIAQRLATAGVSGILNFAPITLKIAGDICVANVDLAAELQQLAFSVARGTSRR